MILILGGTTEARALAERLEEDGREFVSSLAGRVARPRLPRGRVRIGGFGGPEGLARYLTDEKVTCLIDATHPFAAGISANAADAAERTETPLLRLARPGWSAAPGAEDWTWVDTHAEAASAASRFDRPLLTIGRQSIGEFTGPLAGHPVVTRVVDTPEGELPAGWAVVHDRGPYDLAGERELLSANEIDVLVTKDSGGAYTWPKIAAADELGVAVVIVRRPGPEPGVEAVTDVPAALQWVDKQGVDKQGVDHQGAFG